MAKFGVYFQMHAYFCNFSFLEAPDLFLRFLEFGAGDGKSLRVGES